VEPKRNKRNCLKEIEPLVREQIKIWQSRLKKVFKTNTTVSGGGRKQEFEKRRGHTEERNFKASLIKDTTRTLCSLAVSAKKKVKKGRAVRKKPANHQRQKNRNENRGLGKNSEGRSLEKRFCNMGYQKIRFGPIRKPQ